MEIFLKACGMIRTKSMVKGSNFIKTDLCLKGSGLRVKLKIKAGVSSQILVTTKANLKKIKLKGKELTII